MSFLRSYLSLVSLDIAKNRKTFRIDFQGYHPLIYYRKFQQTIYMAGSTKVKRSQLLLYIAHIIIIN